MAVKLSFHNFFFFFEVHPGKPNSTHFEILARFGNTKIEF